MAKIKASDVLVPKISTSVSDRLEEMTDAFVGKVQDEVGLKDNYYNQKLSLGLESYGNEGYTMNSLYNNWALWITLWQSSWIFKKFINKVAEDMVEKGITITTEIEDENARKRIERNLSILNGGDLFHALVIKRLFGGGIAVILVDGVSNDDLKKPASEWFKKQKSFSSKKKKTIRLSVVDRWDGLSLGNSMVANRNDVDYGKPKYYNVMINNVGKPMKVHHSWCLRLEGKKAPRLLDKLLLGWGMPEGCHVFQELIRGDRLRESSISLLEKSLLEIIKMDGMAGLFKGESQEQLEEINNRVTMVTSNRVINNLVMMDTNDQYEQFQASITGLADYLDKCDDYTAGAMDIPRIILLGETKGGLGSDMPTEYVGYAQMIASKQNVEIRPLYEKLLPFLFAVNGVDIPEEGIDFTFNPLWEVTQESKVEKANTFVELMAKLVDMGVMTPQLVARELATHSKEFGFGATLTDEYIESLENETQQESENIEVDEDNEEVNE